MPRNARNVLLAACTAVALVGSPIVHAQLSPAPIEQAELAGLDPQLRAQVQARATGGNSVTEVLQVMLLNNIKAKQPANQIVAMDWGKGVAVVEAAAGSMSVVHFDPKTLQLR
jgi:hypothetical protein